MYRPSMGMIAQIQGAVKQTFNQMATITIPVPDYTANNMGSPGFGTATFTTPCRLAPIEQNNPRENSVGAQWQAESLWRLRVPHGTDVPDNATVTVDGAEFEVVSQQGPRSYEMARSVVLRRRG